MKKVENFGKILGILVALFAIYAGVKGLISNNNQPASIVNNVRGGDQKIENFYGASTAKTSSSPTNKQKSPQIENQSQEKSTIPEQTTKNVDVVQSFHTGNSEEESALLENLLGLGKWNAEDLREINICLQKGANVNTINKESGWSALHVAAICNDTTLAQIILKNGVVDINIRDSIRRATPLWYTAKMSSLNVAAMLLRVPSIRVDLFEKHTNSHSDFFYSTPLDVATDSQLIRLLWLKKAHRFRDLK